MADLRRKKVTKLVAFMKREASTRCCSTG